MVQLRVREVAEERGFTLATLARETKLPQTTARRIWYSTTTGTPNGKPLRAVNLHTLETVAEFLAVEPGTLLKYTSGG